MKCNVICTLSWDCMSLYLTKFKEVGSLKVM